MLGEMKKLRLLVIVMSCVLLTGVIFPDSLFAETVTEEWVARYNGPANSSDLGFAMAVDSSGNVYVTGSSDGSGTGRDYATIKYDSSGNQLWAARYNGPGNNDDFAYAIAVDSWGNVYVTGFSIGISTDADYATIKYDTNGNELWVARYNSPEIILDKAFAIAVDSAGNVYVTGWRGTIKYDTDGNQLWAARYDGLSQASAIALDSSGNVYVTGVGSDIGPGADFATVKHDTNGNKLWMAWYDGPGNYFDTGTAIAVDTSGNVYVTGRSFGSGTYYDYATVKYDSSGNQLWAARYNGTGNSSDSARAIAVDSSGNVYVTGQSHGVGNVDDYATVKYDGNNGNELWVARYDGPENDDDWGEAIALDSSGNVYVTGGSYSSGTDADYATVKYDTNGNELWVARYNGPANSSDSPLGPLAIALDNIGNVYVTGESYGSGTDYDYATIKYSQLANQPPVADAGPDQALLELGTTVTLDGDQSYDDEGDPITYWWTIAEMPAGSAAVLSNPTSAWPSFEADVYGDYIIELVVSDPWASSDPDTVTVSFDNIKPVADAGDNQAVIVGDTVNLDGSGSTDVNFDLLSFSWSFESVPAGSLAVLFDADTVNPSFTADEVGTYVVSLVVNDGLLDSDADTVSIEAISSYDALMQILFELIDRVNLLPEESLKNKNLKKALTNKINDVLAMVDEGLYVEALDKLQKDILGKTDGCAEMGQPDKNDWITTCPEQGQVYPLIMEAIELLGNLI